MIKVLVVEDDTLVTDAAEKFYRHHLKDLDEVSVTIRNSMPLSVAGYDILSLDNQVVGNSVSSCIHESRVLQDELPQIPLVIVHTYSPMAVLSAIENFCGAPVNTMTISKDAFINPYYRDADMGFAEALNLKKG